MRAIVPLPAGPAQRAAAGPLPATAAPRQPPCGPAVAPPRRWPSSLRTLAIGASSGSSSSSSVDQEPRPREAGRPVVVPLPSTRGGGGRVLRDMADLPELAAALEAGAEGWLAVANPSSLCAGFSTACKLGMAPGQPPRDDDPQRAQLLHHTLDRLAAVYLPLVPRLYDAKWCIIPLWACAKAGYWGGGLPGALLQRLGRDGGALMRQANSQDHANVWWSLSVAPKWAFAAGQTAEVLEASADSLQLMGAESIGSQTCSNVLLACARLRHSPGPALLHHLTARLAAQPGANCQELANSLYALGELRRDCGHTPQPLDLQRLAAGVLRRLDGGLGGAGEVGPRGSAGRFMPQELSNMLLGCAKLGYTDPDLLLLPLAAAAGQAAGRMKEQELANSLYALAVLGCNDPAYAPAVLQLAAECKRRNFTGFAAQGVANSAWALGKLGHSSDQGWFAAAVAAAMRPGVLEEFNAQELSNLWYGLALARHRPEPAFLECTIEASEVLRTQAGGQECANLLWSLATLGVPYDPWLVDVLLGRLVELLPQRGAVIAQDLTNSLWALAVMGPGALSDHQRPVEVLLREVVRRWNSSDAGDAGRGGRAGPFTSAAARQLWQVQEELVHADGCSELAGILAGGDGVGSRGSLLGEMQRAADEEGMEAERITSQLQRQVVSALIRLQRRQPTNQRQSAGASRVVSVATELMVEGMVGRVDAVVGLAGGRRVAVEVDGPWHFMANEPHARTKNGRTQLRDRLLERLFGAGNVAGVPYWEWKVLQDDPEREEGYLLRRLGLEAGGR
ncbi:hypothetical protein TSOC_012471 [Tetrabaena socialis]|uniref:RAP domain-containing protein n=1 Tax=Tetrabaena socialis TaxID=47790 RepID=A0A2J7ZMZ3_9CHLO|nr:hypothetical protein TSOC_012471 [Tetrabaena socialis]|eukprot:PNH01626.1 hypothetical protein TSOC_012471 [Tetrabaena socialis]